MYSEICCERIASDNVMVLFKNVRSGLAAAFIAILNYSQLKAGLKIFRAV
jgi:hypothetical protein